MLKLTPEIIGVAARNVLLGGNVASLSLLDRPHDLVAYVSEALFLFKGMTRKRGLPQRNVYEVLPCDGVSAVTLGALRGEDAWFWSIPSYTVDLVSLCLICQIIRPRVVFEIGTLRGYLAYHFALNTPQSARVYTLDLPPDAPVQHALRTTSLDEKIIADHGEQREYYFSGTPVEDKITCLFGDSATYDFTNFRGGVDLFFIDGAHSYEYVRSDTCNAFTCLKSGGVIAWHDFGRTGVNGVSRWLLELARERQIYSVPGGSLAFAVVP